jgi:hypothetical protein
MADGSPQRGCAQRAHRRGGAERQVRRVPQPLDVGPDPPHHGGRGDIPQVGRHGGVVTGGTHDPVALRLQRLDMQLQALVLGQLAASRSDGGSFSPGTAFQLFHDFALPAPAKIGNVFTALTKKKWFAKQPQRAAYKVTRAGQAKVREQMTDLDLVALVAESAHKNAPPVRTDRACARARSPRPARPGPTPPIVPGGPPVRHQRIRHDPVP